MARLVRQLQGQAAAAAAEPNTPLEKPSAAEASGTQEPWAGSPKKLVRTCVASMVGSRKFGPLVAAAAQRRGFYQAKRRAFLGDGQSYNWTIQRGYFPDFVPITDFLHVLCYLYLAAWAVGSDDNQRWSLYLEWLRACWQGRVVAVIAARWVSGKSNWVRCVKEVRPRKTPSVSKCVKAWCTWRTTSHAWIIRVIARQVCR